MKVTNKNTVSLTSSLKLLNVVRKCIGKIKENNRKETKFKNENRLNRKKELNLKKI